MTLTCPATWGDYRRQLMTEAAATARLTGVGLLPEPVAAAVYYASQERLDPDSLVAVYDLGGGTFDATVVRKTAGGFEIHGTAGGDETIGGADFDQVVMDHVASTIGVRWSEFDAEDPAVLAGLAQVRAHAVGAKEALSSDVDATIPVILPDVTRDVRITRGRVRGGDPDPDPAYRGRAGPDAGRGRGRARGPAHRPAGRRVQPDPAGVPADRHGARRPGGGRRPPQVRGLPGRRHLRRIPPASGGDARDRSRSAPAGPASSGPAGVGTTAGPPGTVGGVGAAAVGPSDADLWARPGAPAAPARSPAAWDGPTISTPAVPTPGLSHPTLASPGSAGQAGATVDEGAELLAPEPGVHPAAVHVDLAGAGLEVPLDVLLRPDPVPTRPIPRLTGRDEPLTVAHTGDARRGRLTVLAVVAGAALLVASASALGLAAGSDSGDRGTAPTTAAAAPTTPGPTSAEPGPAPATLTAQPVPGRRGDAMHAVAALPDGGLVAVGASTTEGVPRAWRYTGGRWSQVSGPTGRSTLRGAMTGVAYGGDGLVAVGWVAPRGAQEVTVAQRRPAIWTSKDGRAWSLLSSSAIAGSGAGTGRLGELSDVAARPGGGFVATGVDWGADPDAGDGAVLTSPDGRRWQRSAVKGLDGPGPVQLRRLLAGPGGGLTAVGNRLDGSVSRSVVWTSPDARTWSVAADLESPGRRSPVYGD